MRATKRARLTRDSEHGFEITARSLREMQKNMSGEFLSFTPGIDGVTLSVGVQKILLTRGLARVLAKRLGEW